MIGERFNRWLVVERGEDYIYPNNGKAAIRFICQCDCGAVKLVHKAHLKNGSSQSCSCLNREISSTHGMSTTRAYKAWSHMIRRCDKPAANELTYAERGITYVPEWKDFEKFYADMGDCPDHFELEREDSMSGYSPSNCKWADEITQATNRATFRNNTSGRTGVTWSEVHQKWRVGIHVNKKRYEGGLYEDFEEASVARDRLEITHYGQVKKY